MSPQNSPGNHGRTCELLHQIPLGPFIYKVIYVINRSLHGRSRPIDVRLDALCKSGRHVGGRNVGDSIRHRWSVLVAVFDPQSSLLDTSQATRRYQSPSTIERDSVLEVRDEVDMSPRTMETSL